MVRIIYYDGMSTYTNYADIGILEAIKIMLMNSGFLIDMLVLFICMSTLTFIDKVIVKVYKLLKFDKITVFYRIIVISCGVVFLVFIGNLRFYNLEASNSREQLRYSIVELDTEKYAVVHETDDKFILNKCIEKYMITDSDSFRYYIHKTKEALITEFNTVEDETEIAKYKIVDKDKKQLLYPIDKDSGKVNFEESPAELNTSYPSKTILYIYKNKTLIVEKDSIVITKNIYDEVKILDNNYNLPEVKPLEYPYLDN